MIPETKKKDGDMPKTGKMISAFEILNNIFHGNTSAI